MNEKNVKMKEVKYIILYLAGSGTVINYGSGSDF
jgi:hypothetical protein